MKKLSILLLSLIMISCKPYVVIVQCPHKEHVQVGTITTPGEAIWKYGDNSSITLTPGVVYDDRVVVFDSLRYTTGTLTLTK